MSKKQVTRDAEEKVGITRGANTPGFWKKITLILSFLMHRKTVRDDFTYSQFELDLFKTFENETLLEAREVFSAVSKGIFFLVSSKKYDELLTELRIFLIRLSDAVHDKHRNKNTDLVGDYMSRVIKTRCEGGDAELIGLDGAATVLTTSGRSVTTLYLNKDGLEETHLHAAERMIRIAYQHRDADVQKMVNGKILGTGLLDLDKIVEIVTEVNPEVAAELQSKLFELSIEARCKAGDAEIITLKMCAGVVSSVQGEEIPTILPEEDALENARKGKRLAAVRIIRAGVMSGQRRYELETQGDAKGLARITKLSDQTGVIVKNHLATVGLLTKKDADKVRKHQQQQVKTDFDQLVKEARAKVEATAEAAKIKAEADAVAKAAEAAKPKEQASKRGGRGSEHRNRNSSGGGGSMGDELGKAGHTDSTPAE